MQLMERAKSHHDSMGVMEKLAMGPRGLVSYLDDNGEKGLIRKKSCIYIHVPFCKKICTFCSLRRDLATPRDDYHEMVIKEIENYGSLDYIKNSTFDAVYFGGGTPTTLEPDALRDILIALKKNFNFTEDAEFTIETTLNELTEDKMDMFKEYGVNRFSVGVQTFSNRGRKIFGRIGDGDFAYEKLKTLKEKGFDNVNIDIIYNYADQCKEELLEDLRKVSELNLAGFSLYSLINMRKSDESKAQSIEMDKVLFNTIADYGQENGYKFLELTKMVKRDEYRYIMNRHLGEDTLAIGAGAGGNFQSAMVMNPISLDDYKMSIENFDKRKAMLFNPKYNELTRIKGALQRGIIPKNYNFLEGNKNIDDFILKTLNDGLAMIKDNKIVLTREGLFWGNNISREFLSLLV